MFAAKVTELGLAGIPGNTGRGAAGFSGGPAIYHWPALIDSQKITEHVHIGGKSIEVLPTQRLGLEDIYYQQNPANIQPAPAGPTRVFRLADYSAPARVIKVVMPTSVYGL